MSLFSIAYLPPVEYLHLYLHADKPYMERCENHIKQTYRNRCLIPAANGVLPLIIPLKKNGLHHCPITQIRIDYSQPWQTRHWKTIETAYNASPFFMYYRDYFLPFYADQRFSTLWEYNLALFEAILRLFDIPAKHAFTDSYERSTASQADYRLRIHPKKISQQRYPFADMPHYQQVFSERTGFTANMSCIDLLFNVGKYAKEVLQQEW
jgi:hypothetical protein